MKLTYSKIKLMLLALFAIVSVNVWANEVTDVLNQSVTKITTTNYAEFINLTATSDAVYAGNIAGSNGSIQLRSNNNNSGIITTTSGGTVKKIVVTWNENTAAARELNIYGSDVAYSTAADLYSEDNQGTLIGTLKCENATDGVSTLEIEDEYAYIGLRSKSGAMYLTSIAITWETGAAAPAVAKPVITPNGGYFINTQEVTFSCETEGAAIFYTIDGSEPANGNEPSSSATRYERTLNVTENNTVVRAVAFKDGAKSAEATATFTQIQSYSTLASMSALANNTPFVFTGQLMVTAKPTDKYVYVYDGSSFGLIYDATGLKTTAAEKGKYIPAGWSGKVSIYKNLFEVVPDYSIAVNEAPAQPFNYLEEPISEANIHHVITLKNVTSFSANGKNLSIVVDNEKDIQEAYGAQGYNQFGIEIPEAEEGKTYEIIGAIGRYNDNLQFWPITIQEPTEPQPEPVIGFYVAGSMNNWSVNENYKMTMNEKLVEQGIKEFSLTTTLKAGNEFKVVSSNDGSKITSWFPGDGKGNYTIDADGEYTIYCRPNFDGDDSWYEKCLKVEAVKEPAPEPATELANSDFSKSTPLEGDLFGYGKDASGGAYGLQDITGWNKVVISGDNSNADFPNSGMGGAVFAYGSTNLMRGNQKSAPAAGPNGETGNALGFFAVWGCGGYYYQDVTLAAGTYTLNVPMYCQSGTQANESYTGFFVKDSDVKYTVAVNPAAGSWALQSVTFTLEAETAGEIRVGYKSTGSGSGANPMLFIDGIQLLSELDGAIVAFNTALAAAKTAAADEVVTGSEKEDLNSAITANQNVDKTDIAALKTAATALNEAVATFNAAKASYQDLADLKEEITMVNYNDRFPYASEAKKNAAIATMEGNASSADDAKAKAEAIRNAYRKFADSHAMAEGVEDAVNMTDKIVNPNAESAIAEPWTVINGEGSNGNLSVKDANQEPPTDGEGNTYAYFDGGNWGANAWNVALQQKVKLPAGKYMLTVAGRASVDVALTVFAGENESGIPAFGASGGLFGRGWNNASLEFEMSEEAEIAIGVRGETEAIHNWMSFTRFRLVQLEAAAPEGEDYTAFIVNADLKSTEPAGFDATGTKGIDGSGIVKAGNNAVYDFKQTIAGLPAGKYVVSVQAAYRYGADEQAEAEAYFNDAIETKFAKLYATVGTKTVDVLVKNRYDGASDTDWANGEGSVMVMGKPVPNSSSAVKAWFDAKQYTNEVTFNLAEAGDVTIGIVKTAQPEAGDYTVIGPWTLTRIGDADEEEPEPQPQPDENDMTDKIVNPSFETGDATGWTYEPSNDHGAKRNDNATYTISNADGNYVFNIWSSGNAISQKIEGLPNGTYILKALIATDAGQKVQLNANGKSVQIDASSEGKGVGVEGELEFDVLDNTATIGAEGVNKYWYKVDNFRLFFVKALSLDDLIAAYNDAKADARTIEGKMNTEIKTALEVALRAEVDMSSAESLSAATLALTTAVANAKASVAAYAKAGEILPKMKEFTETTNVYTEEAYEEYYSKWVVKYEDGSLTAAEADALQNPFQRTGWHASITVDNFLLSAWDTNVDFQDAPYYINTWSDEGEKDGSEFFVPFFEYWTGDAESLAQRTLTATMSGLETGKYAVTAWVRVRAKNGYTAPAYGITLTANAGEAVDVAAGDQIGDSQFYIKEFTAEGIVGADGVLKIQFNIAADNNISWLSFKNVMFEKIAEVGVNGIAIDASNDAIYDLTGRRVKTPVKGSLYIINGKKQLVK